MANKEATLSKKLKMLKVKDPQAYELLSKIVNSSGSKPFDWNKLPAGVNEKQLQTLEKLEFLSFKDYSDYVILHGGLKDIILKIK